MTAFLHAVRNAILAISCISAAACIAICGYWEGVRGKAWSGAERPKDFEIATFAIGGFTELLLAGIWIAGWKEEFAFFARIGVELPVLTVLWILWLVDCVLIFPWHTRIYPSGCDAMTEYGKARCREHAALGVLSLLNWIMLLLYTLALLTCALIGRTRGNRIWSRTVHDASFFSHLPPAPTSVPPGTMRLTTPSLLSRLSVEQLRGSVGKKVKISDWPSVSASGSMSSTPSVGTKPLPAMVQVHRSQPHHFGPVPMPPPATSIPPPIPVILAPDPPLPSPVRTWYYDWWDPNISSDVDETPLRTFTRRLSTISEKLERKDTAKTVSTKCGARPSSSSSTLVKKKSESERPSSSKGKKRESKRDSEQSFIVFFP